MSKQQEFGKHYLVEMIDCDAERIKFLEPAKEIFFAPPAKATQLISGIFFINSTPMASAE